MSNKLLPLHPDNLQLDKELQSNFEYLAYEWHELFGLR